MGDILFLMIVISFVFVSNFIAYGVGYNKGELNVKREVIDFVMKEIEEEIKEREE